MNIELKMVNYVKNWHGAFFSRNQNVSMLYHSPLPSWINFNPAWISNYIPNFKCGVRLLVEVWDRINSFVLHLRSNTPSHCAAEINSLWLNDAIRHQTSWTTGIGCVACFTIHDDVIKWNHFPRYWPFVRGIPRTKASDAELWCFLWSVPE